MTGTKALVMRDCGRVVIDAEGGAIKPGRSIWTKVCAVRCLRQPGSGVKSARTPASCKSMWETVLPSQHCSLSFGHGFVGCGQTWFKVCSWLDHKRPAVVNAHLTLACVLLCHTASQLSSWIYLCTVYKNNLKSVKTVYKQSFFSPVHLKSFSFYKLVFFHLFLLDWGPPFLLTCRGTNHSAHQRCSVLISLAINISFIGVCYLGQLQSNH